MRANARKERTFALAGVEVRAVDREPAVIAGHAAVYNYWSEDLGGFKERVVPGAFSKTLVGGDVRALFNHDPNFLLGRTESREYPRAFVRYLVNGGSMAAPDCG